MTELIVGKVRLRSLYLNKKLEVGTLKEVLTSDYNIAHRLYLITNGTKELQEFANIKSEEYSLIAHIKTTHAFAGEAKTQIWAVTHLQPLLIKNPKYTLRCELRHLQSNKVVYKCTLEHKNQEIIYNQIQECIDNLNKIIA
jgi:hypothetical protein